MEGYCTFQETEELRRCIKYDPDLVVLLFCLNDVTEKYLALRQFGGAGLGYHGVADGTASRVLQTLVSMRRYSSLVTALIPTRAEARRREVYSVRMLWERTNAKHVGEAWEQAERELDELRSVCDENGLGLLIAVAPYLEQLVDAPGIDAPQDRLEQYAQTHGIEFIRLKPHFSVAAREAGVSLGSLYLDSSHLTASGNAVIADTIAERFQDTQVFDGRAAPSSWERVLRAVLARNGGSGP